MAKWCFGERLSKAQAPHLAGAALAALLFGPTTSATAPERVPPNAKGDTHSLSTDHKKTTKNKCLLPAKV